MDIGTFAEIVDADTFDFPLCNPQTNAPLLTLVLAGPTHPNMQALKREGERKLSINLKRSRDFQKAVTTSITEVLDDDFVATEREIQRLMAGTLDWKGVEADGKPAPFDRKLVEDWYRKKLWLRNAVSAELMRAENFMKSSAPT